MLAWSRRGIRCGDDPESVLLPLTQPGRSTLRGEPGRNCVLVRGIANQRGRQPDVTYAAWLKQFDAGGDLESPPSDC